MLVTVRADDQRENNDQVVCENPSMPTEVELADQMKSAQ